MTIYPGSFNPWHEGHRDVLEKALKVFDHVIVALGTNPEKQGREFRSGLSDEYFVKNFGDRVTYLSFRGLLVEEIKDLNGDFLVRKKLPPICAVIRGLRNGHDLQYEMNQQYWNEDLGLDIPVVYFVTDRKYSHISSSAIRQIRRMRDE